MGYTHYWHQPELDDKDWRDLCDRCHNIIDSAELLHGVSICSGNGESLPTICSETIALNGDASESEDYESFLLYPGGSNDFCKTARRPYDIVVTAILAYGAAYHGFDVSSDGYAEEWDEGVTLANLATGVPVPNPIFVKDLTDG